MATRDALPPAPRWPPASAVVVCRLVLAEPPRGEAGGWIVCLEGGPLAPLHRRALRWLLDEHDRDEEPSDGGRVVLEVARTELPGGRVGHTYALNRHPLGWPGSGAARGLLWRYLAQESGRPSST